jgi:Fur family ferric uptake transcriptional regulator
MEGAMDDRVRGAGYKLTRPRRDVLAALRAGAGPLTAQEVAARAGTSLASTYRVLALLASLGMVCETADDEGGGGAEPRGRRYSLCSASGHHHHFVCRSCHTALDVASDTMERALERAATELERASGLRIETHELTLRGECAACRGGPDKGGA